MRGAGWLRAALALAAASTAVFAATAVSGFWLAHDPASARETFTLVCAALAAAGLVAVAVRWRQATAMDVTGMLCGLGAVAIAVGLLGQLDTGASAAALVVLVPMAAGAAASRRPGPGGAGRLAITALATAVGTAAVLSAGEVAAATGLAAGAAVGTWMLWRARRGATGFTRVDGAAVAAASLVAAFYVWVLIAPASPIAPDGTAGARLESRRLLWQDVRTMVGDYTFTGGGLAGSTLILSSYASLRHVPYHPHAHNLFLHVALEQGLPGLVGLGGMFLAAAGVLACLVRGGGPAMAPLATVSGAATAAMGWYALFESDWVGSPLLVVMLLPLGLTFGAGWVLMARQDRTGTGSVRFLAGLAPLVVIAAIGFWPGAGARWHANRGAILQTRAELGAYDWPRWPIQDQLRRRGGVDLEPAIRQYQAALALDPRNVTAHRRLGQIDLSRGDVEPALAHLDLAVAAAPGDRAARRLLAEAYALTGDAAGAARLWKGLHASRDELEARLWWYRHAEGESRASRFEDAMRALDGDGFRRSE